MKYDFIDSKYGFTTTIHSMNFTITQWYKFKIWFIFSKYQFWGQNKKCQKFRISENLRFPKKIFFFWNFQFQRFWNFHFQRFWNFQFQRFWNFQFQRFLISEPIWPFCISVQNKVLPWPIVKWVKFIELVTTKTLFSNFSLLLCKIKDHN